MTLQKCNVKNLLCKEDTSGAAGIAYKLEDNSIIGDCNVEQFSMSGSGNIAGILGIGTTIDINQCTVNKLNVNSSNVYGISGIVYCINNSNNSNINNCKVKNLDIKCDSVTTTISGIVSNAWNNTKISNCNVSNVLANIQSLGSGASGLVYCTGNDSIMDNCSVNNFKIISTKGGTDFSGIMAMSRADTRGDNISITECSVKGLHIEVPTARTGGIAFKLDSGSIISRCEVQDMYVKCNNANLIAGIVGKESGSISNCAVNGLNIDAQEASVYDIAGIACDLSGELSDCNANNINVTCKECNVASGILCHGYTNSPIKNCNASNLIITIKANEMYSPPGISGIAYEVNNSIIDCNVENMEVHHNHSNNSNKVNIGGITGLDTPIIENCTVNGLKVESLDNVYFGGISVFHSKSINKCKTSNINLNVQKIGMGGGIAAYGGNIKNCDVDGFKMSKITSTSVYDGMIGGIIGCSEYSSADEKVIDNCTVKNSEINGLYHTGGIVGNTSCDITNCSVEATNLIGNDYIGGIVGMYTGKKCEGNTVTNCNIETTASGVGGIVGHGSNSSSTTIVNDCDVIGTTIKGVNEVGGISGACAVNITNCNVEGGSITGTGEYIGGIQGTGGDLREETAPFYPSTITNCKVKGTTITGGTDVGDIQGKDSYYLSTDGTMTPSGRDKITGCSKEP